MQFVLDNALLILIAATSAFFLWWPTRRDSAQSVSVNQAVLLINREKAFIVDVRTPSAFAASHVANAKNIPLAELAEKLDKSIKNKTRPLIFACDAGITAKKALPIAKKLGFGKSVVLGGGMRAWGDAALPVQSSVEAAKK